MREVDLDDILTAVDAGASPGSPPVTGSELAIYRYSAESAEAYGLIQMPISFWMKGCNGVTAGDHKSLFDCGANKSFIDYRVVDHHGFKLHESPSTVTNGDCARQDSPGTVRVTVQIGAGFTTPIEFRVVKLASFAAIIGMDTIARY
jgi:hypothetical protein